MVRKSKKKVFVAMSGGVDSSVAAFLLQKQGYNVVGIFMKLWQERGVDFRNGGVSFENKCCSVDSYRSAQAVCDQLGIRLYTLNFKELFKEKIVEPFLMGYRRGLTPNPCVVCNKYIKFGELLKRVRKMGGDYLATGHYVRKMSNVPARTTEWKPDVRSGGQCPMSNKCPMSNDKYKINPNIKIRNPKQIRNLKFKTNYKLRPRPEGPRPEGTTNYELLTARDKTKDQSYFLYNLSQQELKHLLFPVGDYTKKHIREIAKKNKLPSFKRPESQEVCFVPNKGLENFLKRHLKLSPGKIMTSEGGEVGKHQGLALYTIGQRKGLHIGGIGPFYVLKKDYQKNQLIVTDQKHENELYSNKLICQNVNWIDPVWARHGAAIQCQARIRYQGELIDCSVETQNFVSHTKNRAQNFAPHQKKRHGAAVRVKFKKPIKAIASGQSVVFYQGNEVLGGGVIDFLK